MSKKLGPWTCVSFEWDSYLGQYCVVIDGDKDRGARYEKYTQSFSGGDLDQFSILDSAMMRLAMTLDGSSAYGSALTIAVECYREQQEAEKDVPPPVDPAEGKPYDNGGSASEMSWLDHAAIDVFASRGGSHVLKADDRAEWAYDCAATLLAEKRKRCP